MLLHSLVYIPTRVEVVHTSHLLSTEPEEKKSDAPSFLEEPIVQKPLYPIAVAAAEPTADNPLGLSETGNVKFNLKLALRLSPHVPNCFATEALKESFQLLFITIL